MIFLMGFFLQSPNSHFNMNFQVDEIERVVSIGDGIAHVIYVS